MSLAVPVPSATIPVLGRFAPRDLVDAFGNHLDFLYWHRGTIDANFWPFGYYLGAWADRFHAGTDYAADYGAPIVASEDGQVVHAGWADDPGNFAGGGRSVDVKVHGGMHYVSNHCSALLVSEGQFVRRGETIAAVGNSGNAAGVHDHFALYTEAPFRLHNPERFLPGGAEAASPLIRPAQLPDTSTGDDSVTIVLPQRVYPTGKLRDIIFKAGTTVQGWDPAKPTPVRSQKFSSDSRAHSNGIFSISQNPVRAPNGSAHHIVDGTYAGLYVFVTQVDEGPEPTC